MPEAGSAYTLDPLQLEGALAALRSAAEAFRPSPLQARLYLWLGRCVKFAVLAFAGVVVALFTMGPVAIGLIAVLFVAASAVAAIFLIVNASLIARTLSQRRLLKKLGLHTLSRSAWKADRRRRFGGRIGAASLTSVGAILLILSGFMVIGFLAVQQEGGPALGAFEVSLVAFLAVPGVTVLIWRMVERSREQLAIVADAERLRATLASIQAEAGTGRVVVPAAVMESVANIEIAHIARERASAVAASVQTVDRGYGLVVAQEVTVYKTALGPGERLAVEELIDEVLEGPLAGDGPEAAGLRHARSADGSIEVDYLVDQAARRVHILAVRGSGAFAVSH